MTFQSLGLPEKLCQALAKANLTTPTAVQAEAIPAALEGRDLISTAKTGSGKTLGFSLPMITRLSQNPNSTALVLVPTRELGVQVQAVLQTYLRAMQMPAPVLIIGGVSFGVQAENLRRNPRVVIATPGRLIDHFQNGRLQMRNVSTLVLDEADRMLDMGFLPQVKQILKHLPTDRQTLLFTATLSDELAKTIPMMMRDPLRISVDTPNTVNADIEQRMVEVEQNDKQDMLLEALQGQMESVLVFARTKRRTDKVAKFLDSYGVRADRIHGDRSQAQRQNAIQNFRNGKVKVLVATDIAARGLDIPLVELVINFDLPEMKEDYVHRIGRTGRAGAKGEALSFVAPDELGHWAYIQGQKRSGGLPQRKQQRGSQGQNRSSRGGHGQRQERSGPPSRADRFAQYDRQESRGPRGFGERRERPSEERGFSGGGKPGGARRGRWVNKPSSPKPQGFRPKFASANSSASN